MVVVRRGVLTLITLLGAGAILPAAPGDLLVYFGTYTGGASKGIYVSRLNAATGALSAPQLAAETPSPSFLAVRAKGDFLYAVNEVNTFEGKPSGSVSAFAIKKDTGMLTPLNARGSGGPGPAHLSLDRDGRTALVANYGGGSIAALTIAADGRLDEATSIIRHAGMAGSVGPDRLAGRLRARMQYADMEEVEAQGPSAFLKTVLDECATIHRLSLIHI